MQVGNRYDNEIVAVNTVDHAVRKSGQTAPTKAPFHLRIREWKS